MEAAVLERPQLTATDELAVAIARRQRWDWRSHAMASISSQTVKRAIRDLARAIAGRLELEPAPKEEFDSSTRSPSERAGCATP